MLHIPEYRGVCELVYCYLCFVGDINFIICTWKAQCQFIADILISKKPGNILIKKDTITIIL